MFSDPQLNALEEQVDSANLNIKIEAERFLQSRAAIRFDRASQYPTISDRTDHRDSEGFCQQAEHYFECAIGHRRLCSAF